MQKLDRILDRNHVLFALAVDLVQHRGKRCGFTRTCRAGHQNQPARLIAKLFHHRRQTQRIKSLNFPGDGAEHGAHGAALIEYVSAKTSQVFQAKREVQLQILLEPMLLRIRQYAVGQRFSVGSGQRRHFQRPQTSMNAYSWRAVGRDVQVASAHLNHFFQQFA